MLHLILLTLFGMALTLIQGTLPALPVKPNMVLVIAIYAGQFYPPIAGILISFVLGYMLDLISGGLLGLNAFTMVSICYISFSFSKRIAVQNLLPLLLTVFLMYMVQGGITYTLFSFFNLEIDLYMHIATTAGDAAAASILSIFVISAIKRMEKWFRYENERSKIPGDLNP